MEITKKLTMPQLIDFIERVGYDGIKVERNVVAFNVHQIDVLTEDEAHDLFMQWLSAAFCFGYIKGVRYQKGRTRVWVYPTTHYESYA
jgi:hypothetical protein